MTPNEYFDAIYCVTLDRRPDRKAQAEEEFAKHNITVEFISGVDGLTLDVTGMQSGDGTPVSKGDLGCSMSHLKVARLCKERGHKRVLVLEDDAVFHDDFNSLFTEYLPEVPENWDFLYLGGNHDKGGMEKVSEHISKIFYSYTTHAYSMTEKVYDAVIDVLSKKGEKVDIAIGSLHGVFNSYVFRPHLAYQRAGFSDILERDVDYPFLKD